MKNKQQILRAVIAKKPPRHEVTDTEFRRKLKAIGEWRKRRLAELGTKKTH